MIYCLSISFSLYFVFTTALDKFYLAKCDLIIKLFLERNILKFDLWIKVVASKISNIT